MMDLRYGIDPVYPQFTFGAHNALIGYLHLF